MNQVERTPDGGKRPVRSPNCPECGYDVTGTNERAPRNARWYAQQNDVEALRRLLDSGGRNPSAPLRSDIDERNAGAFTPIMTAALYGSKEAAAFLLESGADAKARNNGGQTALDIAQAYGHPEVVDLLKTGRAKPATTPVIDDGKLIAAIRSNPQSPDAYYALSALTDVSYEESAQYYEHAVKLDIHKSKAFFPHHWSFALKAAKRQYRGPCIDAFSRALSVDSKRYMADRASLDPNDRYVCAAWDQAKEGIRAYSDPKNDELLWKRQPPIQARGPAAGVTRATPAPRTIDNATATQKFNSAAALYKQGSVAEALRTLQELRDALPENKELMYASALCLIALGRDSEALPLAEKLKTVYADPRGDQLRERLSLQGAPPTPPPPTPRPPTPSIDTERLKAILRETGFLR
jgi:tetratricopeptide (TPR) repeat protein